MTLSDLRDRGTLRGNLRGGGGGGVTSYPDLTDKPKINGATVIGEQNGAYYHLLDDDYISVNEVYDLTYGSNFTFNFGSDSYSVINQLFHESAKGIVKAPSAADISGGKFLRADNTWQSISTSEDIADMTWSSLVYTTTTSASTAIPAGTKYLVLTAELSGTVSLLGYVSIDVINKVISESGISKFNMGYEYYDTGGNHTNISMTIDSGNVVCKSGYNTVTARVYALS